MPRKSPKKVGPDYFRSCYLDLRNDIELRKVAINEMGRFAEEYDKKHIDNWKKLIKKLDKKKNFSEGDIIDLTEMRQKHPRQSSLFKRNMIVSIVTVIDECFSEIIYHYYFNHKSKLPLDTLKISFKQLDKFSNIDEIKHHMLDLEINNILTKEGVRDRLKLFKSELNIDVPEDTNHIKEFHKLIKLRNLIVHKACFADKEYVKKYGDGTLKEGERIDINTEYLHDALDIAYFICGYILQSAQISMHQNHLKEGDNFLNLLTHEFLVNKRYSYIDEIYEKSLGMKIDESNKKMIAINYCVALKLRKKSKKSIEKVLSLYDWSAVDETYKLAMHALRDEDKLFYEKLQVEIKNKNIGVRELRSWAIFGLYNKKKKYREIIKGIDLKQPT